MTYSYIFKFIIVGDSSVGKSCILNRFVNGEYNRDFNTTIGVDYENKMISINDTNIKLKIFDTAGAEKFDCIIKSYYRNIAGAIIVYDITNKSSFDNINNWIKKIKNENPCDIPILIVGNKIDLNVNREVEFKDLENYASNKGYLYRETSVKYNTNIDELFFSLSENILSKIERRILEVKRENGIDIGSQWINNNSINIRSKPRVMISKCC